MKKSLFIILLSVVLLMGCNREENTQQKEENKQMVSDEQSSQTDISASKEVNQDDIDRIKFYVLVMNNLDTSLKYANNLFEVTEDLRTYVSAGYEVRGYEIGITNLDAISSKHSNVMYDFSEHKETTDLILNINEHRSYNEDLSKLQELVDIIERMEKEYVNAYQQIELYIKTGESEHKENHYVHEDRNFELSLEAEDIAEINKSKYFVKIVDY